MWGGTDQTQRYLSVLNSEECGLSDLGPVIPGTETAGAALVPALCLPSGSAACSQGALPGPTAPASSQAVFTSRLGDDRWAKHSSKQGDFLMQTQRLQMCEGRMDVAGTKGRVSLEEMAR